MSNMIKDGYLLLMAALFLLSATIVVLSIRLIRKIKGIQT